ncbi:Polycomb protein esc [Lucilia cuprina]|nr:Polycomb protein esc [Lucilia cuprina]
MSKVKADKLSPKESAKAENSENESICDETASVSTSTTSRSKSPGSRGGRRKSRHSKSHVNVPAFKYE